MTQQTGLGSALGWVLAAMVAAVLPWLFSTPGSLSLMSLMGIAIVFALSYNLLLGETGLLSFGHAVYYGVGAFATAHALNRLAAAGVALPLPLLPLAGGLAGLLLAAVLGWPSTRRAGTAFAMISLGIGELVGSSSLILRGIFGGEGGISTNRTALGDWLGLSFGPQVQMYYLIAAWCLVCAWAMRWLGSTALGRMANAVRDNPERVAFLCYSTHQVRWRMFCVAGFFAGVAGGLAALQFEIVTVSVLSTQQSGQVLLMAFIGGSAFFAGPVVGAVLMTALQVSLSDYTGAWLVYLGLLFMTLVLFAPGGLVGLALMHRPAVRAGLLKRLAPSYALLLPLLLLTAVLAGLSVESLHQLLVKAGEGVWPVHSAAWWCGLAALWAGAVWSLRATLPHSRAALHAATQDALSRGIA